MQKKGHAYGGVSGQGMAGLSVARCSSCCDGTSGSRRSGRNTRSRGSTG